MVFKKQFPFIRIYLPFLSFLLFLATCGHTPEEAPEPLRGFFEKVSTLGTTTVRSYLREDLSKQRLLEEKLPFFEKMTNLNQLSSKLKKMNSLKELVPLIEKDIFFELQKLEHRKEKEEFHSPDIQPQLISSITFGMRRALNQLKGELDAE
ncbi:MAG: hypothetical protein ACUVTN_08145 [Thermodesulfobacteriota bacterium]